MEKGNKSIVEFPTMMVHSWKGRKKDMGDTNGIIANHTKGNFKGIRLTGLGSTEQNSMNMKGIFKMVKRANQAF